MSLFSQVALAADGGRVILTVKQVLIGTDLSVQQSKIFRYRLIPASTSQPMPEGSETNGYDFSIAGKGGIDIGPIIFTQSGVYTYEIRYVASPIPEYMCDHETYTIDVFVAGDLTTSVVVRKEDGLKVSEIRYTHFSDTDEPEPTKPPKPAKPNKPTKPNKPVKPVRPDGTITTGDGSDWFYWVALAVAAACVLLIALPRRRKQEDKVAQFRNV